MSVKRKISRNGQIAIPKELQRELGIQDGDYLNIDFTNNKVIIDNLMQNNYLNQCIINRGKVTIPTEIRRIMNIQHGTHFIIELSNDRKKLYLLKD